MSPDFPAVPIDKDTQSHKKQVRDWLIGAYYHSKFPESNYDDPQISNEAIRSLLDMTDILIRMSNSVSQDSINGQITHQSTQSLTAPSPLYPDATIEEVGEVFGLVSELVSIELLRTLCPRGNFSISPHYLDSHGGLDIIIASTEQSQLPLIGLDIKNMRQSSDSKLVQNPYVLAHQLPVITVGLSQQDFGKGRIIPHLLQNFPPSMDCIVDNCLKTNRTAVRIAESMIARIATFSNNQEIDLLVKEMQLSLNVYHAHH